MDGKEPAKGTKNKRDQSEEGAEGGCSGNQVKKVFAGGMNNHVCYW